MGDQSSPSHLKGVDEGVVLKDDETAVHRNVHLPVVTMMEIASAAEGFFDPNGFKVRGGIRSMLPPPQARKSIVPTRSPGNSQGPW